MMTSGVPVVYDDGPPPWQPQPALDMWALQFTAESLPAIGFLSAGACRAGLQYTASENSCQHIFCDFTQEFPV